jgi:hypothetical protein
MCVHVLLCISFILTIVLRVLIIFNHHRAFSLEISHVLGADLVLGFGKNTLDEVAVRTGMGMGMGMGTGMGMCMGTGMGGGNRRRLELLRRIFMILQT